MNISGIGSGGLKKNAETHSEILNQNRFKPKMGQYWEIYLEEQKQDQNSQEMNPEFKYRRKG